jgi:predicted nuclease of restriction endonuclease-like (RecB) superfamily
MSEINPQDYNDFFNEIVGYIRDRQLRAMRSVNHELVSLYWGIGALIHLKQKSLGWGKSVVETLARDLQAKFSGQNGFSANSLWLMHQFCHEYVDKPNLRPTVGEISWVKNQFIFGRCKDNLEREFYLRATICRSKNKTVVEYALRNAVRPIGVATYSIVPQLPDAYREELPSPEAIAERLRLWDNKEIDDE